MYSDTGRCVPESSDSLLLQQEQLNRGKRHVQMFPTGTVELSLPAGLCRHQNARGVFHYRATSISAAEIETSSALGKENEFLMLGPYSKPEIADRYLAGETLLTVTEYTPAGVELRCATGTNATIAEQRDYFERTKEPGNSIVVGNLSEVIIKRLVA